MVFSEWYKYEYGANWDPEVAPLTYLIDEYSEWCFINGLAPEWDCA